MVRDIRIRIGEQDIHGFDLGKKHYVLKEFDWERKEAILTEVSKDEVIENIDSLINTVMGKLNKDEFIKIVLKNALKPLPYNEILEMLKRLERHEPRVLVKRGCVELMIAGKKGRRKGFVIVG